MKEKWLVPDYCQNFRCKGNTCRHTCCSGWKIAVSKKEYYQLVTMDCSEKLNQKIQRAMSVPGQMDDRRYRFISHDYQGYCPILEDGWCLLYQEKGEESVPEICRLFPRSYRKINDQNLLICSCSCEKVLELLYENKGLQMIEAELDAKANLISLIKEEDSRKNIEMAAVLTDREIPLAERLAKISRILNQEAFDQQQQSKEDPLENMLKLLSHLNCQDGQLSEIITAALERYEKNPASYQEDKAQFEKSFPDWMNFFEAVIYNSLLYENFFLLENKTDRSNSYRGLCTVYGLLRLLNISCVSSYTDTEGLIDVTAALFRLVDHSPFYEKISLLKDNSAIRLQL